MQYILLASTTTEETSGDLLGSLGIDWQLLLVQLVSFLLLYALLNKFVFPYLFRAIDKRQASIEAASKAAEEASKSAQASEKKSAEQLEKAKKEAAEIVALAHKESAAMIEEAESKASKKAEHMIQQAESRIESDIAEAHRSLQQEVVKLVALATEKVIGGAMTNEIDEKIIKKSIKDIR